MKRILIFVAIVMMAVLSGCKKEEDSGLAGTVWEGTDSEGVVTLSFTSIQAVLEFDNGGPIYYYSYEYQKPTVMMYPEDIKNATLKGIVSGKQMSVVNTSNGKTLGIYIKR